MDCHTHKSLKFLWKNSWGTYIVSFSVSVIVLKFCCHFFQGDFAKVKELLEEGAPPNVKDNAGWTPLVSRRPNFLPDCSDLLLGRTRTENGINSVLLWTNFFFFLAWSVQPWLHPDCRAPAELRGSDQHTRLWQRDSSTRRNSEQQNRNRKTACVQRSFCYGQVIQWFLPCRSKFPEQNKLKWPRTLNITKESAWCVVLFCVSFRNMKGLTAIDLAHNRSEAMKEALETPLANTQAARTITVQKQNSSAWDSSLGYLCFFHSPCSLSWQKWILPIVYFQALPVDLEIHQVVLLATGLSREQKRKLDQLALILHAKCLDEFSCEGMATFSKPNDVHFSAVTTNLTRLKDSSLYITLSFQWRIWWRKQMFPTCAPGRWNTWNASWLENGSSISNVSSLQFVNPCQRFGPEVVGHVAVCGSLFPSTGFSTTKKQPSFAQEDTGPK